MSIVYGKDGRDLITTEQAALYRGYKGPAKAATFRRWAANQGLIVRCYVRNPKGGQEIALWDIKDIEDKSLDKQRKRVTRLAQQS